MRILEFAAVRGPVDYVFQYIKLQLSTVTFQLQKRDPNGRSETNRCAFWNDTTQPDRSILTKDVLFPALRKAIETHPALGVRMEEESTSKAFFVKLGSIELSHVVEFSDTDDLQAAFEGQLARPFDTDADLPLWRVEVLADNTVIVAMHHAIGDGLSTVVFHTSLFQGLQTIDSSNGSSSVLIPDTVELLPPIEAVTSLRPSLPKSAWTGRPVPETASLRTHVRLMKFTAPDVAAFTDTCRAHRATLSSALYILTVSVLSHMIANDPARYKTISANVTLSLRGAAGARADVICDYASVHHTYPRADPTFTWAAAARYAAELRTQKTKAREVVGMLRFLFGHYVLYMKRQLGRKRAAAFVISNLGRFDAPAGEGKWRIENTVFAQCDVVLGAALKLNVVGDPTGAVNIALTWGNRASTRRLSSPSYHDSRTLFVAFLCRVLVKSSSGSGDGS
ncbi:hypothetical protein B0H10DRAFT_2215842 [Mycena sp. CBHHK59/15]|nr:hypothetical protein B0H10DRAFT_2215842 [Mycena sp. CBHHK59/15]